MSDPDDPDDSPPTADIRELMVRARDLGTPADWLVRSTHNRALPQGG
jgi:hypothetical protein